MKAYKGDKFNYFSGVETAKVLSSVKVAARKKRRLYPYITYSSTPRIGIPGIEKKRKVTDGYKQLNMMDVGFISNEESLLKLGNYFSNKNLTPSEMFLSLNKQVV